MLCSFSTIEAAKVMRFVRSFAAAVSILPGGSKFEPGPVVLPDSENIVERESELAHIFDEFTRYARDMHLQKEVIGRI